MELPVIDRHLIEISGEGWRRPLDCIGFMEADDDNDYCSYMTT